MDWAATTAWSELPVEELTGDGGEGRVLIRCVLSKEPYFDGVNDRDRSWYLMMLPDSEEQFWGYAPQILHWTRSFSISSSSAGSCWIARRKYAQPCAFPDPTKLPSQIDLKSSN